MSSLPVIVIGSGLAGYSFAREFRKLDSTTPLCIISQDDGHNYSKPMLSNALSKGKTADQLSMGDPGKMSAQLEAEIRTKTTVKAINTADKTIDVDGEAVAYRSLVLAQGAVIRRLNFEGFDHPLVYSINDLMDYRAFREAIEGKKKILVMGAGLIGCEFANDLLSEAYDIEIVHPFDEPLTGLAPAPIGQALGQALENAGVKIHLNQSVCQIVSKGQGVEATLESGQTLTADLVVSAVGLLPNVDLAKGANIHCEQGIVVDRNLRTSAEDVYALGDCAQVDGHVMLYVLPLMASARALAKELSGEATQVHYGPMPVVIKTPSCPIVLLNPIDPSAGEWSFEVDGANIRGICSDQAGNMLGFALSGDCIKEKQALANEVKGVHD